MDKHPARIAHVLPWKAIGGTELATLRVARSASEGGFDSVMVCRSDAPIVAKFFASQGFEVVLFDPAEWDGRTFGRFWGPLRLMRSLRRRGIEVVHCADVFGGDFVAIGARLAGHVVICHVRNRYEWLTRKQRVWLRFVHQLVFVSKHTADTFGQLAFGIRKLAAKKRLVLYDGMSTEAIGSTKDPLSVRQALRIPDHSILIGMVARISIQKDHLTLVAAATIVCREHPNAFFVFIGDDGSEGGAEPENAALVKQAISDSPCRSRFLLTGFRSDVPDLIAALDIFVLCTHREGLPLVILEAMAQAKPVIATAVDGIPEIVIPNETGMLHKHQDASGLAECIAALVVDADYRRQLGEQGRKFVENNFSQKKFTDNVCKMYEIAVQADQHAIGITNGMKSR